MTGECFLCHRYGYLHRHHIFGGANREKSEQYGLVVLLCPSCHNQGRDSVHFGYTPLAHNRRVMLHQYGREKAMQEQGWSIDEFLGEFRKTYLGEEMYEQV